jgi:hypothetical protein
MMKSPTSIGIGILKGLGTLNGSLGKGIFGKGILPGNLEGRGNGGNRGFVPGNGGSFGAGGVGTFGLGIFGGETAGGSKGVGTLGTVGLTGGLTPGRLKGTLLGVPGSTTGLGTTTGGTVVGAGAVLTPDLNPGCIIRDIDGSVMITPGLMNHLPKHSL